MQFKSIHMPGKPFAVRGAKWGFVSGLAMAGPAVVPGKNTTPVPADRWFPEGKVRPPVKDWDASKDEPKGSKRRGKGLRREACR